MIELKKKKKAERKKHKSGICLSADFVSSTHVGGVNEPALQGQYARECVAFIYIYI